MVIAKISNKLVVSAADGYMRSQNWYLSLEIMSFIISIRDGQYD